MNWQYRYGSTFTGAAKILYDEGGYGRYYQGLGAALIQGAFLCLGACSPSEGDSSLKLLHLGPVSRFGDTAANAGILALLASVVPEATPDARADYLCSPLVLSAPFPSGLIWT